ncbi:hypothetical protein [Streptomyces sp. NPDC020141]|uniref:hypothetical protein n=1 Tax=Streptomyces sp. NPDC020141 TaxID=3365065 RepID=UPI0037BD9D64
MHAVREGDADALLSDALTLYGFAEKYPDLTVTGKALMPGRVNYGLAMPKGRLEECLQLKKAVKGYIRSIEWTKDINDLPQVFRKDDWTDYLPVAQQIDELSCRGETDS